MPAAGELPVTLVELRTILRICASSSSDRGLALVFGTCFKGHDMASFAAPHAWFTCDVCAQVAPQRAKLLGCRDCNFDVCVCCQVKLFRFFTGAGEDLEMKIRTKVPRSVVREYLQSPHEDVRSRLLLQQAVFPLTKICVLCFAAGLPIELIRELASMLGAEECWRPCF